MTRRAGSNAQGPGTASTCGSQGGTEGHKEVKGDEAQSGIPELIWLQASSFGLTTKKGPERRSKLWELLLGVRRRLFLKRPSHGGTAA